MSRRSLEDDDAETSDAKRARVEPEDDGSDHDEQEQSDMEIEIDVDSDGMSDGDQDDTVSDIELTDNDANSEDEDEPVQGQSNKKRRSGSSGKGSKAPGQAAHSEAGIIKKIECKVSAAVTCCAAVQRLGLADRRELLLLFPCVLCVLLLQNFMCHRNLVVELGRNINFINGANGSGKSAILAALQICLGARAKFTHRANKLTDLIRCVPRSREESCTDWRERASLLLSYYDWQLNNGPLCCSVTTFIAFFALQAWL